MTGLAHVDGDVVNRQMQARNAASQVFFRREADLADHILIVPSHQIPRVQEVQASIDHVMLDMLDALSRAR